MESGYILIVFMVLIVLAVPVGVFWGVWNARHHNDKLLKCYNRIKIGDRYLHSEGHLHPFDPAINHYAQIIDKKLADGKHPWVQFRYDDGSVSQCELHDFLMNHKKINH